VLVLLVLLLVLVLLVLLLVLVLLVLLLVLLVLLVVLVLLVLLLLLVVLVLLLLLLLLLVVVLLLLLLLLLLGLLPLLLDLVLGDVLLEHLDSHGVGQHSVLDGRGVVRGDTPADTHTAEPPLLGQHAGHARHESGGGVLEPLLLCRSLCGGDGSTRVLFSSLFALEPEGPLVRHGALDVLGNPLEAQGLG